MEVMYPTLMVAELTPGALAVLPESPLAVVVADPPEVVSVVPGSWRCRKTFVTGCR
jgi:hypothetical protein